MYFFKGPTRNSQLYLQDYYLGLDKTFTEAEIEAGVLTEQFLAFIYEIAKEKNLEVFIEEKLITLERRADGSGIYKIITETDYTRKLVESRKAA